MCRQFILFLFLYFSFTFTKYKNVIDETNMRRDFTEDSCQ